MDGVDWLAPLFTPLQKYSKGLAATARFQEVTLSFWTEGVDTVVRRVYADE